MYLDHRRILIEKVGNLRSISIRRFASQASAVVREVERTGKPVVVTRLGEPVVIISADPQHTGTAATPPSSRPAPGDLLIAAVVDALYSNPAAFPTRQEYLNNPDHDVNGWLITDDRAAGDIAILTNKLVHITEAAGIDVLPSLRALRKRGVLLTDTAGALRRPLRVGTAIRKTYTLNLGLTRTRNIAPGAQLSQLISKSVLEPQVDKLRED